MKASLIFVVTSVFCAAVAFHPHPRSQGTAPTLDPRTVQKNKPPSNKNVIVGRVLYKVQKNLHHTSIVPTTLQPASSSEFVDGENDLNNEQENILYETQANDVPPILNKKPPLARSEDVLDSME